MYSLLIKQFLKQLMHIIFDATPLNVKIWWFLHVNMKKIYICIKLVLLLKR